MCVVRMRNMCSERYAHEHVQDEGNGCSFQGDDSPQNCFCLPSEEGSNLKGKNLVPVGANFIFY